MKPFIDVCIASYKRPDSLRNLLESLVRQETEGRFDFAIHVVDNDAQRSAEEVVRAFRDAGAHVTYDVEPVQSISLARNRSLACARGEWIATIDDDLWADRRWLLNMLDAALRFDADVVHGWTLQRYLPGTADYIRRFHDRPHPPTGSTAGYIISTGDSLFRRALVEGTDAPFDPRLGRTGGEDTRFFDDLRKRGCRMIFSREANVICDVPAERSKLRWILKRRMRHGSNLPLVKGQHLTLADSAHHLFTIVTRLAFSALCLVAASFVFCGRVPCVCFRRARMVFVTALLTSAYFYGRLRRHFGREFEEYRTR